MLIGVDYVVREHVPMNIRPYRPGDAALTLDICRRAILETANRHYSRRELAAWLPDDDVGDWAERVLSGPYGDGAEAFVAEIDGSTAGFISFAVRGEEARIDLLYVDPDYARQGAATALVNHVVSICQDRQIPTCTVEASHTLRPLLEHLSFKLVKSQRVTRREVSLENHLMRRDF